MCVVLPERSLNIQPGISSWYSRAIPVPHLVKRFLVFYGTWNSLPSSQMATTEPYSKPTESSAPSLQPTSLRLILTLLYILHLCLTCGPFPKSLILKSCMLFSFPLRLLRIPQNSSSLIQYLMKSRNYYALCNLIFLSIQSLCTLFPNTLILWSSLDVRV
jgi:hypothetical protein